MLRESTIDEAQTASEPGRLTYQLLLLIASVIFLLLPLVTTFNDLLTSVVMRLGLDEFLRGWVGAYGDQDDRCHLEALRHPRCC